MGEISRMQKLAGIHENMFQESYDLIIESVNPDNHYDFKHHNRNRWIFNDRTGVTHFTVVNKSMDYNNACEIKFGWVDEKGIKRYDKPLIYDERIFNTHIYIIINEILESYKDLFKYIILKATDDIRYRLYRINISKFLFKSNYDVILQPQNNTIILDNKDNLEQEEEPNPYS